MNMDKSKVVKKKILMTQVNSIYYSIQFRPDDLSQPSDDHKGKIPFLPAENILFALNP